MLRLSAGPVPADVPTIRQAMVANAAGVPGVSVPVGLHSAGVPMGVQLLGPWGGEPLLLAVAQRIEDAGVKLGEPRR